MKNPVDNTTNETAYLNTLRVLAVAGVITAHVFVQINSFYSSALMDIERAFSLFMRNAVNWNVPLFVMITGVIFLNPQKELTLRKLLLRHELRLLLALLVFGTFFSLLEILFNEGFSFRPGYLPLAAMNVLQGNTWNTLWYLYMITGLYLLLPLFKIFCKFCDRKTLEYILVVLFVFTSVFPTIKAMTGFETGWNAGGGYLPVISVYVFYLFLGHYIHNYKVHINRTILSLIICLYIFCAVFGSAVWQSGSQSAMEKLVLNYNSPLVILVSASIFMLLRQNNGAHKFFDSLSPLCFGIFLLHMLFINFFYKFLHFTPLKYPFWLVWVTVSALAFFGSACVTWLMRKIKAVREYLL